MSLFEVGNSRPLDHHPGTTDLTCVRLDDLSVDSAVAPQSEDRRMRRQCRRCCRDANEMRTNGYLILLGHGDKAKAKAANGCLFNCSAEAMLLQIFIFIAAT